MDLVVKAFAGNRKAKNCINIDAARSIWTQLLQKNKATFFSTWGWIENWLTALPQDVSVSLAVLNEANDPCCALFFGKNTVTRRKIFKSKALFINTTGIKRYDDLCIQYNSMAGNKDVGLLKLIFEKIEDDWEEIYLPAISCEKTTMAALIEAFPDKKIIIDKNLHSYYVDLNSEWKNINGYLSVLSSGARSQIRRSYRGYNVFGKLSVEVADNETRALEIFEELVRLHQSTWEARGYSGSFSNKFFYGFHKQLIKKRFKNNEIQLIKVAAGSETLACLYNLVYNKKVFCYQSGIKYQKDPRLKPGMVAHTEAIAYNAGIGNRVYDFLASDEIYKKRLSTNSRNIVWLRIQKPLLKFRIENKLVQIKRKLFVKS